jgi:predicted RNA binding protein YcfA (HicA-like mRNA interferase family)
VEIPKTLDQRTAQKLLEQHGWVRTVGGKHNVKMTKQGQRPITLPRHHGQQYSRALARAILRQAGLT